MVDLLEIIFVRLNSYSLLYVFYHWMKESTNSKRYPLGICRIFSTCLHYPKFVRRFAIPSFSRLSLDLLSILKMSFILANSMYRGSNLHPSLSLVLYASPFYSTSLMFYVSCKKCNKTNGLKDDLSLSLLSPSFLPSKSNGLLHLIILFIEYLSLSIPYHGLLIRTLCNNLVFSCCS